MLQSRSRRRSLLLRGRVVLQSIKLPLLLCRRSSHLQTVFDDAPFLAGGIERLAFDDILSTEDAVYGIGNSIWAAYLFGLDTRRIIMIALPVSGFRFPVFGALSAWRCASGGYASKLAGPMGDAYPQRRCSVEPRSSAGGATSSGV